MFMKSFLYKYYNILCSDIVFLDNHYSFNINNTIFNLYEVSDLSSVLTQFNNCVNFNFFDAFVKNNYNSFFSPFEKKVFILLKSSSFVFKKEFLFNTSLFLNRYCILNWKNLWQNKIDYVTTFYKKNYDLFDKYFIDIFDYFIGLAENAVILLNKIDLYYSSACISYVNYFNDDFCNPLNTKIDVIERNFAEYLRLLFYKNIYINYDFSELFFKYRNIYNYNLVFIRLIYPHYFFELLDDYMLNNNKNNIYSIKKVVSFINKYEDYLHLLLSEMKKYQFLQIDI